MTTNFNIKHHNHAGEVILTLQKLTLKADICRLDVVQHLYLVRRTHFGLVQYQTAWVLEESFFALD